MGYTISVMILQSEEIAGFDEREGKKGLLSTLVSPFLTFLGSSTFICAGGACSSIYISTITSFFGAFGIAVVDLVPYMDGLAITLVLFTLYSLYIQEKDWRYKPFIIGTIGGLCIIINIFFISPERYLLYFGNVLMIGAAIWNSRLSAPAV